MSQNMIIGLDRKAKHEIADVQRDLEQIKRMIQETNEKIDKLKKK